LEWYDSDGKLRQTECAGNGTEMSILSEWPGAVLAWPYWPEKGLAAGFFYPAGAIFPFDVSGETIILCWEAGAEAYFYRELDKARSPQSSNRVPEYFDWKRFRTFLRKEAPEEIRTDPWLVNWKDIAEKTIRSGFRTSYVRTEARISTEIIIPHTGPWLSSSPFKQIEFWEKDEKITILLSSRPEVFVCPGGMLSASSGTWLWTLFP
jgi:hypothetical protein